MIILKPFIMKMMVVLLRFGGGGGLEAGDGQVAGKRGQVEAVEVDLGAVGGGQGRGGTAACEVVLYELEADEGQDE